MTAQSKPVWISALMLVMSVLVFVVLVGLGTWQLQRLSWKTELVATIEKRAFAESVLAPQGPVSWQDHAYQRVQATGIFHHHLSRRVKALTDLGAGYWLMTPLQTGGRSIWINRGFLPAGISPADIERPTGEQRIEGLLRLTEVGGTWLEGNDAQADRWFSRDILALSDHVGLQQVESYFIDADKGPTQAQWPRGGLTQLDFRNTHLSYALTWFTLALMLLATLVYVIFVEPRKPGLLRFFG